MAAPVTRIISDLHYADSTSWVRSLASLRPLFEEADQIIVNGDAVDSQATDDGPGLLAEVKSFFAEFAPPTEFITGNHDPDISSVHELSLCDNRAWLTHGDILFDDIAPWSAAVGEIRRRLVHLSAHLSPVERAQIETRLRLFRLASFKLPRECDPGDRNLLRCAIRLFRVFFPPQRTLAMLRCWRDGPGLADALAEAQRPAAQLVVVGHTHCPVVWRAPSGRVIVNTGAFGPMRGPLAVELAAEKVRVVSIARRGGFFRLDEKVAEFPLAPATVSRVCASA